MRHRDKREIQNCVLFLSIRMGIDRDCCITAALIKKMHMFFFMWNVKFNEHKINIPECITVCKA